MKEFYTNDKISFSLKFLIFLDERIDEQSNWWRNYKIDEGRSHLTYKNVCSRETNCKRVNGTSDIVTH